jgi:hypothetical protein
MQVIPLESIPLTQLKNQYRDGTIRAYRIVEGEPGPGNFSLRLVNIAGKYFSPRHRHNFDQVRYQLAGTFDYEVDGKLGPGELGYFPEGTRYGPQTCETDTSNLLLQFGGASGAGYTTEAEAQVAAEALKAKGRFEKGVFTYNKPDGTKVNQDAYEAIWEHIHGRELVYPKERYVRPVLMDPAHFAWLPIAGQPGTAKKIAGVFSERATRLAFFKVDAGATLALEPMSLYFVLSGAGSVGGKPYLKHTTLYLKAGEAANVVATQATELLQIGLPQH